METRKIERRPDYRLFKKDLEGLTEDDFILISTGRDKVYFKVNVGAILNRYEKGIGAPGGKPSVHWNSSIAGVSATDGVPLWMKEIAVEEIPVQRQFKTWIFQGNPDTFEMDRYLMEVTDEITWRVKRHKNEIEVGDIVYLWRASGKVEKAIPGIIARAVVSSEVFEGTDDVKALEYWKSEEKKNEVVDRVRLKVLEVNREVGMIAKDQILNNEILKDLLIIKSPQGTTFPLKESEESELEKIWRDECQWNNEDRDSRENKTPRRKKVERDQIERSQWVVDQTILRAKYKCEVPGCENILFEKENGDLYVEVHHLVTLASGGPDTVSNTACLCPGHHREIHYGKNKQKLTAQLVEMRVKNDR